MKRGNNMVNVHLDVDGAHDEQGDWWFPYSPEGNNMFHCMPDEGARVRFISEAAWRRRRWRYSVRGGSEEMTSRTVF